MRTKKNLKSKCRDIIEEIDIKSEKPDSVVEEIILCDPIDELPENVTVSIRESKSLTDNISKGSAYASEKILLKSTFRGLLPTKINESYFSFLKNPVVKRCRIEHCYFVGNRLKQCRYNFRNSTGQSEKTDRFENENLNEQQTIDFECLTTRDVNCAPEKPFQNKNILKKKRQRTLSSSSSSSGSSCRSDTVSGADHSNEYGSSDNSNDSERFDLVDAVWSKKSPLSDRKRFPRYRFLPKRYPASGTPNDFVSVDDLLGKIKNMKKLMKSNCESSLNGEKLDKVPLLKVKKTNRKDDVSKSSQNLFPTPNLGTVTNGEKNWDDVQSLGLDDLLLKASELNAENFTKALGQKVDPLKGNFKESSEIFFTIPKPKKSDVETNLESPEKTGLNLNTIKLDISKPFFEAEKEKEGDTGQEVPKMEEASPKKLGIKVKTVENINEEFKESVGLKGKSFEDSGKQMGLFEKSFLDSENKLKENLEKNLEENPFVMTIVQNKMKKQRPAILRNSSYFKRKNVSEKPKPVESDGTIGTKSYELEKSLVDRLQEFSEINVLKSESSKKNPSKNFGENDIIDTRSLDKNKSISFILSKDGETSNACNKPQTATKLVKATEGTDKTLKIMSIEQKLVPQDTTRRFIKVVPYEPVKKCGKKLETIRRAEVLSKMSDDESPKDDKRAYLSLTAFSTILREILPDRWFLCLDKKFGLQIIKTHIDELLNPSILISVVIARCGKLTVNVRGKQLKESHQLFSNLCEMRNSEDKLSLNYVLGILNKLRCLSVCFGCDDPSLKKYWSGDGSVEHHSEFQQVYRSHLCQLLVSLGKKRCYPCYRMNESLKKRFRKDKQETKSKEDEEKDQNTKETEVEELDNIPKARGVKRNLEDFLEKSFSTMRQQISDEIEKNKKLDEEESAMKAQEEVLSFMGLARKGSLTESSVRKSKRKKTSFYKLQPPVKKKIDQQELEFLEKYWTDINTLFSTSLLFGAYSRTGTGRLREKCRMFQKLLSTWREIVKSNPDWIGRDIALSEELDEDASTKDSKQDQFEQMDVPALRAYIINSVKEVNKIKHKLRTKNSYFKILYNKFVKRRMKRTKSLDSKEGHGSSTNTPTPTDFSSDESSRDKGKTTDEDNKPLCDIALTCGSDGD